jgi:RNA polymerase sigma-70 factor (ECF subfamily)
MVIGTGFDDVLGAAQAGAEWAFAVLYRDLNPRLVRYFAAKAPSVAEDLASETWLAAAGQLRSFRGGEGAFRAWLFTIGRRRLIQHWRHAGRHPAQPVAPETLIDQAGTDDTELSVLDAAGAWSAARAIAQVLSRDQADVVLLRVLAGLDVDQVAQILGKRPGTVRVLQHKALRRLAGKFSLEALTQ